MRTGRPLIIALVFLAACNSKPVAEPVAEPMVEPGETQAPQAMEEEAALVWPPPAPEEQLVALAESPLAKNYMVVFDGSGSMNDEGCSGSDTKAVVAKQAITDFAQVIAAEANVGLVAFDRSARPSVRVPLGSRNRQTFIEAVHATQPGSSTPLRAAVVLARQELEKQARRQQGYGEYSMVIVTDGEADAGQNPTQAVNQILVQTPIIIHTIGFCIGTDHSLNQPGRTVYKAANNPAALRQGLEDVLAESPVFDVSDFSG